MVEQTPLTERQERVLAAASAVEEGGRAGTPTEIADAADVPVEAVREDLSALISDELDLLREVPAPDGVTGPRYTVKSRPSPGT